MPMVTWVSPLVVGEEAGDLRVLLLESVLEQRR
jgi:hypothetical protein